MKNKNDVGRCCLVNLYKVLHSEDGRVSVFVAFLVVILLIGVGYYHFFYTGRTGGMNETDAVCINLGCETSIMGAPVWIALHNDYFAEQNLTVNVKPFESGKASLEEMLKSVDIDMATVAQTPIMFNSFRRDDFCIIAAMISSYTDVKVLGYGDIKEASDLIGKKVGLTKGTTGQFFFDAFLVFKGVSNNDIEIVDLRPLDLAQAFFTRKVDAICSWEPHITNARSLVDGKAGVLSSDDIYREDFYLVTKRNFADKNIQVLTRFLKAIEKAEIFLNENKQQSIDILAVKLKTPKELIEEIWPEFEFRLVLDQSILISLEDEARWAIREKLVEKEKIPNYLKFISVDALKAIKPESVRVVK